MNLMKAFLLRVLAADVRPAAPARRSGPQPSVACVACLHVARRDQPAQWVRIIYRRREYFFCDQCGPTRGCRDFWKRLKRCRRWAARKAQAAWN
jgi:hypothetical protein